MALIGFGGGLPMAESMQDMVCADNGAPTTCRQELRARMDAIRAEPVPGKEEYLNSEKYEIRAFDWNAPGNIREDVAFFNRLRAEEPAMKAFRNLAFYNFYNENILYYGKRTEDKSSFLLFIVSLDPHNPQGGHFEVPLWEFGLPDNGSLKVEDLTDGRQFVWQGKVQHWWIAPSQRPYAVLRISA